MFGRDKVFPIILILFTLTLTTLVVAQNATAEADEIIEIVDFGEEDLAISPEPTPPSTKRGVRGQAILIPSIIVIFFIFCCY